MTQWIVKRTVNSSNESVFRAISDIPNLPDTNPDIVKIEIHTEQQSGVGTRFRETRMMNGKEAITDLEITEYVENERVRMVSDNHGTVWDTVFETRAKDGATELVVTMDARYYKFLPKILMPLMKGMIGKGFEKHIDAVKSYCERG